MSGDGTALPYYRRGLFRPGQAPSRIGDGAVGGKARGLIRARDLLAERFPSGRFPGVEFHLPALVVLTTDVFEAFLERNDLHRFRSSDLPDDRIAHAFQEASLPAEYLGDVRALTEEVHVPVAVRSSSLLEDALYRPFAGVYETKMTPNNQADPGLRFQRLVEAIKFVYASAFFRSAREYIEAAGESPERERMAVILQEVVGHRHSERFYPDVSGVARSYSFYPVGGGAREDGVVELALGLGKTIVDGGLCYPFSPGRPQAPPPFADAGELMDCTQKTFWAVNMGGIPAYDPTRETEYLVEAGLEDAEYDGTLRYTASTFVSDTGRLSPGIGRSGPRVLDFGPLLQLQEYPLAEILRTVLEAAREREEVPVEIEFALRFPRERRDEPAYFGFLQMRPMVVSEKVVEIGEEELSDPSLLLASDRVMGNGVEEGIRDVVYVRPERFEARHSRKVAEELAPINRSLRGEDRPYLLIGFGRWGSSDPWLGIPVDWSRISGARVIVEAALPAMEVEPSQGAHFFHNISSFEVSYFNVGFRTGPGIDWAWLNGCEAVTETEFVRHVRLPGPLTVKVDGRTGRGGIWRGRP